MENNDVLRRLRYALNLDDAAVGELFALGGSPTDPEQVARRLLRDDDPDLFFCDDDAFEAFLDGLILKRRGPPKGDAPPPPWTGITNNAVLKKLRIALSLRDVDTIEILHMGGHQVSKAVLGGLLRPPHHRNFRPCGDQFLRAFLRGLTMSLRGGGAAAPSGR